MGIEEEDFGVEEIIPHPFYNILPGLHDIAILRLNRSIPLLGELKIIPLNRNKFINYSCILWTFIIEFYGKMRKVETYSNCKIRM